MNRRPLFLIVEDTLIFALIGALVALILTIGGCRTVSETRTIPRDLDAETAVLGAVLLDPGSLDKIYWLRSSDFSNPENEAVFAAMQALHDRGQGIDCVTLRGALHEPPEDLDKRLLYFADRVPTAANIGHYAGIIREKALLRAYIQAGTNLVAGAYEPEAVPEAVAERHEQAMAQAKGVRSGQLWSAREVARATLGWLETVQEKTDGMTGVPTGLESLDSLLFGLQPTDLVILAARPSMGKTSLALNIAQNAAIRHNMPVVIFSLEMSKEQLGTRLLSSLSGLTPGILRSPIKYDSHQRAIEEASVMFSGAPLYIDDTAGISLRELAHKARRIKRMCKDAQLGLIVVDYLQLMSVPRAENRTLAIAALSGGLKNLAKQLGWPVLALSQLNRDLEKRGDKMPMLADLRDSGALEQDADVVAFLYRPAVYFTSTAKHPDKVRFLDVPEEDWGKLVLFMLAKNRNGPAPRLRRLTFNEGLTLFTDYEGIEPGSTQENLL